MRPARVVLLVAMSLAGCASRTKRVGTEVPARSAELTAASAAPGEQAQQCESPCENTMLPRVQIVLPLRTLDAALVDAALEDQLRPLARELESLREKLLACGVDRGPVIRLARQGEEMSVEFRGTDLSGKDAACLRAVLKGGLTPSLVHAEIDIGILDRPPPAPEAGLSKDQMRSVVAQHIAEFRDCLLQHVDPRLYEAAALRYLVRFQVDKAGRVRCLEPQNRDPELAAFSCCFVPQMLRWRFPPIENGYDYVDVNYPFLVESTPD